MANETTTIEVLAEFSGETVARAISTPVEILAPFGRSRRPALFGYSENNKSLKTQSRLIWFHATPLPFTCSRSSGDALKMMTRRGVMVASTPVLGLRPILAPFDRTLNIPKVRSLMFSPPEQQVWLVVSPFLAYSKN